MSCIKFHIKCNLVITASSSVKLLACIANPVYQVSFYKTVNIFIFISNLKRTVVYILYNTFQSGKNLILLIFCQNSLFCKHFYMCHAAFYILMKELLVKGNRCIEIIYKLICLFGKSTTPELCHV